MYDDVYSMKIVLLFQVKVEFLADGSETVTEYTCDHLVVSGNIYV